MSVVSARLGMLSFTNLSKSTFTNAKLNKVRSQRAIFTGANMKNIIIKNSFFNDAQIASANFSYSKINSTVNFSFVVLSIFLLSDPIAIAKFFQSLG